MQAEAREAGPEGGGGHGIWPAARGPVDAGNCSSAPQGIPEQAREEPDWLPEASWAASPGRTSAIAEGGAARGCSVWASRVLGQ